MSTKEQGKLHLDDLAQCPVCAAEQGSGCVSIRGGLGATPLRPYRIHKSRTKAPAPRPWSPHRETPPPGWADVPPLITEQTRHDLRKGLELARDQFGERIRRAVADAPPPKLQKRAPLTGNSPSIVKLIAGIRRDARDAERWRQYQAALKGGDNEQ